jgi:hypothetical protein
MATVFTTSIPLKAPSFGQPATELALFFLYLTGLFAPLAIGSVKVRSGYIFVFT